MSKSQEYTACFPSTIRDCDIESNPMGNFVRAMYGKPKLTHVNEARYATFLLSFVPKNDRDPLQENQRNQCQYASPHVSQPCTRK